MDEKVLIFINRETLNYWFNYICSILRKNSIDCRTIYWTKEILIGNIKIFLKTYEETKWQFFAGRHDIICFYNIENKLENNFKKTLKEILLDGKSRD